MANDRCNGVALVIDDERLAGKTAAALLQRLGFDPVLTAAAGQEALNLITSGHPPIDLVLTDLNMPDLDGIELLRRLDELKFRGDIVLFSGEDSQTLRMAENLARARGLSVLGSLTKPVAPQALREILAKRRETAAPAEARPSQELSVEHLAKAIEAGELEPWFQPKIDVARREPVGAEALVRWPHGPTGPVSPGVIVSLAEEHGLIDPLTFLMLEKSVRFRRLWREQGVDLTLAINVSMDSLIRLDFPQRVADLVERLGEKAEGVQFEVTESRLMSDLVRVLDVLLRLRLKRFWLAIDDFGTGHSSLAQLRDLPFNKLKLDRSYVQGAGNEERARAILQSSVEMAKRLGMVVVAEGVETLADWQRVERFGCDQVQGYFIARPMPGDAVPAWVRAWPERRDALFGAAPR